MANRINHFTIPVLDLERAAAFYKKVLACQVWIQRDEGYAIFEWEKGDVTGGLTVAGVGQDVGNAGADGVRVNLNCEGRLDDAIAEVRANGGHLVDICSLGDYGLQAIVRDTEGNCVHLHSYSKIGAEVAVSNVSPPSKVNVK